jgi:cbb3-type cytochrome oxidase maturation protein
VHDNQSTIDLRRIRPRRVTSGTSAFPVARRWPYVHWRTHRGSPRRFRRGARAVSVIFIVVPLAGLIVLAAVIAFVSSARGGQFDDLDTPAVRMLQDEPAARPSSQVSAPPPSTSRQS